MPYNGTLSVVIERPDSEIPFFEEKIGISKEDEYFISQQPKEVQESLLKAIGNKTEKVATKEGLEMASRRMENSFLLIMRPS